MTKLVTVAFHGDTLFAIDGPDGPAVAVKPISDRLGLDWRGQRQRIERSPVLAKGRCVMPLPSVGGPQETVCLRLDLVPGWLFGIDVERVRPEARDAVLQYQEQCFGALAAHFYGAPSDIPRGKVTDPTREEPVRIRRQLVTEARQTFGERAAGRLWFALGLPTVPEMHAPPDQGDLGFTYTARPIAAPAPTAPARA